jgi:hypothetical protein
MILTILACAGKSDGEPPEGTRSRDIDTALPDDSSTPPDDSGTSPDDSGTLPDDSGDPAQLCFTVTFARADGGEDDTVMSGGESGTILDVLGPDVTLTVTNVTLDRGWAKDPEHDTGGGGIHCLDFGAVTVTDVVFSNNTAMDGAGLYAVDCDVRVTRGRFEDNAAEDDGGALVAWYGTVTLTDTTFTGNVARDGGAMLLTNSATIITGGEVTDNVSGTYAGGIWAYEGTLTMTGTTLAGNVSTGSPQGGMGGALTTNGTVTLDAVTFADNAAVYGGGLFLYEEAVVEGRACDFSGNTPDDIYVADSRDAPAVSYTGGDDFSFSCAANVCTAE